MTYPLNLLEEAARLRSEAERASRLAAGLNAADYGNLTRFADKLREQATKLERQAAGATPQRPSEPDRDATQDEQKPKKGRGGSNDPNPQS